MIEILATVIIIINWSKVFLITATVPQHLRLGEIQQRIRTAGWLAKSSTHSLNAYSVSDIWPALVFKEGTIYCGETFSR